MAIKAILTILFLLTLSWISCSENTGSEERMSHSFEADSSQESNDNPLSVQKRKARSAETSPKPKSAEKSQSKSKDDKAKSNEKNEANGTEKEPKSKESKDKSSDKNNGTSAEKSGGKSTDIGSTIAGEEEYVTSSANDMVTEIAETTTGSLGSDTVGTSSESHWSTTSMTESISMDSTSTLAAHESTLVVNPTDQLSTLSQILDTTTDSDAVPTDTTSSPPGPTTEFHTSTETIASEITTAALFSSTADQETTMQTDEVGSETTEMRTSSTKSLPSTAFSSLSERSSAFSPTTDPENGNSVGLVSSTISIIPEHIETSGVQSTERSPVPPRTESMSITAGGLGSNNSSITSTTTEPMTTKTQPTSTISPKTEKTQSDISTTTSELPKSSSHKLVPTTTQSESEYASSSSSQDTEKSSSTFEFSSTDFTESALASKTMQLAKTKSTVPHYSMKASQPDVSKITPPILPTTSSAAELITSNTQSSVALVSENEPILTSRSQESHSTNSESIPDDNPTGETGGSKITDETPVGTEGTVPEITGGTSEAGNTVPDLLSTPRKQSKTKTTPKPTIPMKTDQTTTPHATEAMTDKQSQQASSASTSINLAPTIASTEANQDHNTAASLGDLPVSSMTHTSDLHSSVATNKTPIATSGISRSMTTEIPNPSTGSPSSAPSEIASPISTNISPASGLQTTRETMPPEPHTITKAAVTRQSQVTEKATAASSSLPMITTQKMNQGVSDAASISPEPTSKTGHSMSPSTIVSVSIGQVITSRSAAEKSVATSIIVSSKVITSIGRDLSTKVSIVQSTIGSVPSMHVSPVMTKMESKSTPLLSTSTSSAAISPSTLLSQPLSSKPSTQVLNSQSTASKSSITFSQSSSPSTVKLINKMNHSKSSSTVSSSKMTSTVSAARVTGTPGITNGLSTIVTVKESKPTPQFQSVDISKATSIGIGTGTDESIGDSTSPTHFMPDGVAQFFKENQWVVVLIGLAITAILGLTACTAWSFCMHPPALQKILLV